MISYNSLKTFLYLNGLLISIGFLEHKIVYFFDNIFLSFFIILSLFLIRNLFLVYFVDMNLKNKENLSNIIIKENYNNEFKINLLSSTMIESLTYIFIKELFYNKNFISNNIFYDLLLFIPYSFVFEIIFDFFHYWGHRIIHLNKFLYVNIHKKHHTYKNPISIIAFYQHPIDLIITNSIPQILTILIFPYISSLQFNIILLYKSIVEISGHSNKKSYPNGSFIQFIWFPKLFNIQLYTENHNLHHVLGNCNYSKRFSLWDKVFKTYKTINM